MKSKGGMEKAASIQLTVYLIDFTEEARSIISEIPPDVPPHIGSLPNTHAHMGVSPPQLQCRLSSSILPGTMSGGARAAPNSISLTYPKKTTERKSPGVS